MRPKIRCDEKSWKIWQNLGELNCLRLQDLYFHACATAQAERRRLDQMHPTTAGSVSLPLLPDKARGEKNSVQIGQRLKLAIIVLLLLVLDLDSVSRG